VWTKEMSLWNSWNTYIFSIHQIENVFHVDLENSLLRWGESWKLIKGFEQLLHILILSPFGIGEREKCISKQYQSWNLKVDETIEHFPCNKTKPIKGLDHGLTTNHFKDMDNVMINLPMCNGRTKLKQLQE
jgi:hypothetical protein